MREYLLVCVIAGVVTFVMTPAVRWVAARFGAVTPVRGRDVHTVPIPRLGGLAMLVGFGVALLVATQLPYLSERVANRQLYGVLAAATLICLLGAVDDFRELGAITKFAGQLLVAGVLVFSGVQLVALPIGGVYTILPQPLLIALTAFIVLATTNAVNFIDGLDGLAAGVVAIAGATFFVWAYSLPSTPDATGRYSVFTAAAFVSAGVVGCCLGFLPHNFHPARLFMGDSGALLLGLLLSAATISLTGDFDPLVTDTTTTAVAAWLPIALPVAILALPVLDVLLAIIRRRGNFHQADSKHLHHKMLQIGHSHRRAVLLLYLWSAAVAFGVLAYAFTTPAIASTVLAVLLASALLLTWGVPSWPRHKRL